LLNQFIFKNQKLDPEFLIEIMVILVRVLSLKRYIIDLIIVYL